MTNGKEQTPLPKCDLRKLQRRIPVRLPEGYAPVYMPTPESLEEKVDVLYMTSQITEHTRDAALEYLTSSVVHDDDDFIRYCIYSDDPKKASKIDYFTREDIMRFGYTGNKMVKVTTTVK